MQHKPDAREDVYFVLTSFAHVIIAVLFGFLLDPVHFPTLAVFTFAISSKAFEHLSLSDPELRVEENTARVELSGKNPGSSVSAWSRCEELSLLGAIRMTLQVNAKWGIRQVVFTSKGNLLAV